MARRLAHEAIDLAEAEPGALAGRLGGEERLESALQRVLLMPAAGVGDRDHDVLAGLHRLGHCVA